MPLVVIGGIIFITMEGQHIRKVVLVASTALLIICAAYLSSFNVPHPVSIAYDIHRNLRSTEYNVPLSFNDPKTVANKQRAAIAASVCKGVDHKGSDPMDQIRRAESVLRSLMDHGSTLPRILLVSGFDFEQYKHLLKNKELDANYGFDKIVNIPNADLALKLRQNGDGVYATNDSIQDREDGTCTTLKFWAWELQDEFDVILHTDTDLCFMQNPDAYVLNFMESPDQKSFQAFCEVKARGWTGFNVHLMMFRPNREIGKLLRLKAKGGDFVAYTNTEQDVIETVYSPSSQCVESQSQADLFPSHHHGKKWVWNGKSCYKMW